MANRISIVELRGGKREFTNLEHCGETKHNLQTRKIHKEKRIFHAAQSLGSGWVQCDLKEIHFYEDTNLVGVPEASRCWSKYQSLPAAFLTECRGWKFMKWTARAGH